MNTELGSLGKAGDAGDLDERAQGVSPNQEVINAALRDHQSAVGDWKYRTAAADLHLWAERINVEFKLETGCPSLRIDSLRRAYGTFRPGRNSFGLRDELSIDREHLVGNPYWRVLGTLLHELLHSWQQRHGKPSRSNYHNKQFRTKAAGYGLIVEKNGYTQYQPGDTPFLLFLSKHGVTPPEIPGVTVTQLSRRGSAEKLHLYVCPCGVRARIGRRQFNAQCLDCGGRFVLQK